MDSNLGEALGLTSSPVAVILTDEKPDSALQFREGRWGCVGAMLVSASKGHSVVFDRQTFGCPGGGTGLGFGNQYEQCGFAIDKLLARGDKQIAETMQRKSHWEEGERFFESPELAGQAIAAMPMTDVPTEYVVFKPLELAEPDEPTLIVFLVNPDQLSALVVLAGYDRGANEGAIAPFGAACHSILYGYAEAQREQPRAVIGFFDIAVRSKVARDILSLTVPYSLYRRMDANVAGSFLEMADWLALRERQ